MRIPPLRLLLTLGLFAPMACDSGSSGTDLDPEDAPERLLTVLYTSDEHGWIEEGPGTEGAAKLMGLWRSMEGFDEGGDYLVLSGGDSWTGRAISTWFDGASTVAVMNAIGKNDLAVLLSERDRLGQEIQALLAEKTNPWGITIEAVEIRDIIIPKDLEDAMSRQAQAERERQSRIVLSTAETEIAEKFAKASEHYQGNPVALHLRAMNMVYEGLRQKGSMIIVPSSAVESMGLGALGGLTAFDNGGHLDPDAGTRSGDGTTVGPAGPETPSSTGS